VLAFGVGGICGSRLGGYAIDDACSECLQAGVIEFTINLVVYI